MINASGVEAESYRCGSISSATAASGQTSTQRSGRRWGRPRNGKRADASMCKSLTFSASKNCDQAVMDVLAVSHVGKFPPKLGEAPGEEAYGQGYMCLDRGWSLSGFVHLSGLCLFPCVFFNSNRTYLIDFPLSQRTMGSGCKLCHLAGSPRGGVRGFQAQSYSNKSEFSINKMKNKLPKTENFTPSHHPSPVPQGTIL